MQLRPSRRRPLNSNSSLQLFDMTCTSRRVSNNKRSVLTTGTPASCRSASKESGVSCWPSPLFQGHPPLTPPPWQLLRLLARPAASKTLRVDQRFDPPKTPRSRSPPSSLCLSCTAAAAALSSSRLAARSTTRRQQYGDIGPSASGSSSSRLVLRTLARQRSHISPDRLASHFPSARLASTVLLVCGGCGHAETTTQPAATRSNFHWATSGSGPHRLPITATKQV